MLLRNRGGGEAGSMARGISIARALSPARVTCIETGTKNNGGITNVTEPTVAGVSWVWQQSIEHSFIPAILPDMSCPQSSCELVESGAGVALLL